MKPVCDAFLDLFSNLLYLVFFLNFGYFFCLTCKNNKKNYEKAEIEETKKNKEKNNIQWQIEFVRVHSFMTSAKSRPSPLPFPLYA